jgi:hypothetical protein
VDFEDSLERLRPTLSENEKIWSVFESSLDILISEGGDSNGREKALEFINQNNNMLMNYSEEVTAIVADDVRHKSTVQMYYTIFIGVISML